MDKRQNLPEIEASVEKCLMLDRLISYITEVKYKFLVAKKEFVVLKNFLLIQECRPVYIAYI